MSEITQEKLRSEPSMASNVWLESFRTLHNFPGLSGFDLSWIQTWGHDDGHLLASVWVDTHTSLRAEMCVLMGRVSVRLTGRVCVLWLRFCSLSCLSAPCICCAPVHVWRFFGVQGVQCPLVCKCVSPGEDNSPGHLTEGLQTAGITWRRLKATSLLPDLLLRLRRQLGHTGTHTTHAGSR